jgi:hypothetical protein
MNKLTDKQLLERAKHEQLLEETGRCNTLGSKLVNMAKRLEMVEVYWGVSNGGSADGMVNQLDRILNDLQEIRQNPFKK